jgi:hypothetical protein
MNFEKVKNNFLITWRLHRRIQFCKTNMDIGYQVALRRTQKFHVRNELLNAEKASAEEGKNESILACTDPLKFQMA